MIGLRVGVEAALAFAVGAMWFALSAVLLGGSLPHHALVILAVILLDVLVVLAIARFWGISYAVPAGVASVVALDWYYIPPTHRSTVPDPENFAGLAAYLVTGVLLGELAANARRRAVVCPRGLASRWPVSRPLFVAWPPSSHERRRPPRCLRRSPRRSASSSLST
jgi:K+-sensing histidine kinase KdpD